MKEFVEDAKNLTIESVKSTALVKFDEDRKKALRIIDQMKLDL